MKIRSELLQTVSNSLKLNTFSLVITIKERVKLEEKIKIVIEKKEVAVRAQNWDEAAKFRDEEGN